MFGTARRKSDVDLTFYQAAHALSVERRLTEPWLETRSLPTLTRSYPRRFTFYVADPISSIETRSLPTLTRSYPRRFTFYVADPISSIQLFTATTVTEEFLLCFVLIRRKNETFDRLAGDEPIHNLRDVRDRDAPVKKVIGFD
jgi:hypothetical protein